MAVRFNLRKYEAIKQAYLEYLRKGKIDKDMLQNFATYKSYLEVDEEICNLQQTIKSLKEAEKKRFEEQKREEKKRKEEQQTEKKRFKETKKAAKERAKADGRVARATINSKIERHEITINEPHVSKPYVGRVNNFVRQALSVSTRAEADALFNKILRLRPALSANELSSVIELCKQITNESLSHHLINLFTPRLKRAQELIDINTKNFIDKLHKKPTNPEFVRIFPTPMGGQNKRY
jgi:hypothetical protein